MRTFRFLNRDPRSLRLRIVSGRVANDYRFTPGKDGWDVVSYDKLGVLVRYWIDAVEGLTRDSWHCSCPGMTSPRRGVRKDCKHVAALKVALDRLADEAAKKLETEVKDR